MRVSSYLTYSAVLLVATLWCDVSTAFTAPHRSIKAAPSLVRTPSAGVQQLKRQVSTTPTTRLLVVVDDPEKAEAKNEFSISGAAFSLIFLLYKIVSFPFPMLRTVESAKSSKTSFRLRDCVLAISAFVAVGAVAYTRIFETWTLLDAVYFTVGSFSSVGYGDLAPSSVASKIFTIFFSYGGLAFLGIAVGNIYSSLIDTELTAVDVAKRLSNKNIMEVFEDMPRILKEEADSDDELETSPRSTKAKFILSEPGPARYWIKSFLKCIPGMLPASALVVIGGTLMGRLEGWSLLDSIYYSFNTASTLGFGDNSPVTINGRIFALFFIPLAVTAGGQFIGTISSLLVQRREQVRNDKLLNRKFDLNYFLKMDKNNSGRVSRMDYVHFMLKQMNVVDQPLLDELNQQFDRLDVLNTDDLSIADLRRMAQLKGVAD